MSFIPTKTMELLRTKGHVRRREEVKLDEPVTLSGSYSCRDKDNNKLWIWAGVNNGMVRVSDFAYSAELIGVFENFAAQRNLIFNGIEILWDQYDSTEGYLDAIYDGLELR